MSPENSVNWRTKVEPLFGYPDALAGITRERREQMIPVRWPS